MDWHQTLGFLAIVVTATCVQTVWGFALALTIVGCVALLDLAPITVTAAVVSVLALVNALWALRDVYLHVRWRVVVIAMCTQAPAVGAGLVLLEALSESSTRSIHILLGACVIVSSSLLMFRPTPRSTPSTRLATVLVGTASGLFSGLFSAGGLVWVYYMYRQPLPFSAVRATLLTMVAASSATRIFLLGAAGGITRDMVAYTTLSLPAVLLTTLVAKRFTPAVSDSNMRRGAFTILAVIGFLLLAR